MSFEKLCRSSMNIKEILNIKYPLLLGGMAQISMGVFAVSVSNAGGLGF